MRHVSGRPLIKTGEPGIYRRGGRYVVTYRDPAGRLRKKAAATLAEARFHRRTLTADVARGEWRPQSRVTFAEYAPEWIDAYVGRTRRGIGERTKTMYRVDLGLGSDGKPAHPPRLAMKHLGGIRLTEITAGHVKQYAAHLTSQGLARSSVRRHLAPVKALLATAHEDGLIRHNPTVGARLIAADQTEEVVDRVKAFSPVELAALLQHTPGEWRLFFEFLAETGLRIGEAVEVRWSDIDRGRLRLAVDRQFNRGEVSLPKGRKRRTVPLSRPMDAALWALRKETQGADGDLVFESARGQRIDQGNVAARVLAPTLNAAGIGDWATWHSFRHTALTMRFRMGWNAAQVARFAGHSDAGFTLRTYVHLLDDDLPEPEGVHEAIAVATRSEPIEGGITGASGHTETGRNAEADEKAETVEIATIMPLQATTPKPAETGASGYESAALTN